MSEAPAGEAEGSPSPATRVRWRLVSLLAVLLVAPDVASAQPQAPPVFRSGVQIIEVDVRVFDTEGRFVADLTPEDFEVLENGVPQKLQTAYLVGEIGTVPISGETKPDMGTVPISSPPADAARQTWVFVFDLNHLTPGAGFDRAATAVREFIRDRFQEGDVGGVVAGTRMVNNRLTSVREELVAAVNSVKPLPDARSRQRELRQDWPRFQDDSEAFEVANENRDVLQRVVTRACSDDPDACSLVLPDMEVRQKARRLTEASQNATQETLNAMNALASGLARMPGPKTIVLLSDGFVAERMESSVRSVVGQTGRGGARVYAIDVRGLDRGRGAGIIDQRVVDDSVGGLSSIDAPADGPNSLAVDTGGMMIRNENNIGRALDTIAQDANRYYVLGYQPQDANFDGKFRPIEVRVRRDGVRVRARRGYLALEPARMLVARTITEDSRPTPGSVAAEPRDEVATPETYPEHPAPPDAPSASAPSPSAPSAPSASSAPSTEFTHRLRPDSADRIRAFAGDRPAAGALAERGWDAYQRGDVDAALPLFAEAAEDPGVRPWVVYALGWSQAAVGRPADAAASWERVRAAAPDFEPVYMDLADAYIQLSEVSKALAVLRDAEQRWPDDPDVHNAVGVIHVRRGALDGAIAAFSKAMAVAPDEALTYFNLGRAYEMRYSLGLRYISSQRRWMFSDEDRRKAMEYYEQYVKRGGPYARDAREAIIRLEWAARPGSAERDQ